MYRYYVPVSCTYAIAVFAIAARFKLNPICILLMTQQRGQLLLAMRGVLTFIYTQLVALNISIILLPIWTHYSETLAH